MFTYNFTINDYHHNIFTGNQRSKLCTEIELSSNQIMCTYFFWEKIFTRPFRNMKKENYLDFSDSIKISKISKQINEIKSIKVKYLFIFSFIDICMVILPLLLFLICLINICVCGEWLIIDAYSFLLFATLFSAFFALMSFTKTLVITFDDQDKISIPYGGILNLNLKKNKKNIAALKKELKNILF